MCVCVCACHYSRNTSLIVAVLQEAFFFTSALGFICGRKCPSANKVLLIVHTSFSVNLTWMHSTQHVEADFHNAFCGISAHPKKPI